MIFLDSANLDDVRQAMGEHPLSQQAIEEFDAAR